MFKDFVVVAGGEGKIAVDFVEGRSVDLLVVHTKKEDGEGWTRVRCKKPSANVSNIYGITLSSSTNHS